MSPIDTRKNKRLLDEEVFVENSNYARHRLKARFKLIAPFICKDCGLGDSWNGKGLVLHLEHINGISSDHRKENLCFLCPNCHSQTDTYCARNKKNPHRSPKPYIDKLGFRRNVA